MGMIPHGPVKGRGRGEKDVPKRYKLPAILISPKYLSAFDSPDPEVVQDTGSSIRDRRGIRVQYPNIQRMSICDS
jgi:hypothetical protein